MSDPAAAVAAMSQYELEGLPVWLGTKKLPGAYMVSVDLAARRGLVVIRGSLFSVDGVKAVQVDDKEPNPTEGTKQ